MAIRNAEHLGNLGREIRGQSRPSILFENLGVAQLQSAMRRLLSSQKAAFGRFCGKSRHGFHGRKVRA